MKKLLLTGVTVFTMSFSYAQEYYHGLGLQYDMGMFNYSYTTSSLDYSCNCGAGVPGVVYKASLAFEAGRNSNMAISSYPFLGFYLSSTAGSYLGVELPVLFEFYTGDLDDNTFFAGAGFSYSFIASDDEGGVIMGPQVGIGGQFPVRDKLIGIRGAYTLGINKRNDIPADATVSKDKKYLIGLGFYYVLGQ